VPSAETCFGSAAQLERAPPDCIDVIVLVFLSGGLAFFDLYLLLSGLR
jgi:hypothetical protein